MVTHPDICPILFLLSSKLIQVSLKWGKYATILSVVKLNIGISSVSIK